MTKKSTVTKSHAGRSLANEKKEPTRDGRHRVIPNLSLKGPDIMRRMQNRTLILNGKGNIYSLEDKIDSLKKMNRTDIARARLANANHIQSLQQQTANK